MSDLPTIVDSLKGVGVSGTAAVAAWKVFGPSLGIFGDNMGKWTERWSEGFFRISDRAARKLGDKAEQPGEVPPRIMQRVVTDGAWANDPVVEEYYAGLIAGSRSSDGSDDSNLSTIALLAGLGSREVRLHYVIYRTIRLGLQFGWRMGPGEGRTAAAVYLPTDSVAQAMDLPVATVVTEVPRWIASLGRLELIESATWASGPPESLTRAARPADWEAPAHGMFVLPSWLGVDLALKADGGDLNVGGFLFGYGWDEVAEVQYDARTAAFPKAPSNFEALEALRERTSTGDRMDDHPDRGWALPDLPTHSDAEP